MPTTPFFQQFDALAGPNGTWIKPGGRVAAYVRSTGAQEGDDLFATSGGLVSTIAAGVARCRAGQNDIVYVRPGHTETVTTTLFTPVSGAQVIGCGLPGAANAPNITLSATAATLALSAANMTLAGLNINSATAAVTGAIVVTAAGVTLANNFISFTGALGANSPIQVTGAANCTIENNTIVVNSTAAIIAIAGAGSTNFVVRGNTIRQSQATSGGNYIGVANTAGISGVCAFNLGKTARALTTDNTGWQLDGANVVANVLNVENYGTDNVATAAVLGNGATAA